jgi:UPF0755 protein
VPDVHTRKHTFALLFVFLVVVILGGAVLAATVVWTRIGEPYKGYSAAETFVDIPPGAGAADIRRRLLDARVVRDDWTLRAALWWSGEARNLQAGEYRFDAPISPLDVIRKITRGDVYTRRITFPEGLTVTEMARLYESRGFGTAASFVEAAGDESKIKAIDPAARDLEGYLFPETYALPRGVPASRLVGMMVDRFLATYSDDLRRRADEQGLTTRQVVTLASLVEKETARPEEHALVAAVYRNRMRLGMAMQADPTVIYALQKAGQYNGNIRRQDLQFDSPYNTYRYPGLPPGPIAAPGRQALEATLAPADVPYIYFVSRNDGSHVFAETLAQHNANVHEYQVLYFRRQRQERARQP